MSRRWGRREEVGGEGVGGKEEETERRRRVVDEVVPLS